MPLACDDPAAGAHDEGDALGLIEFPLRVPAEGGEGDFRLVNAELVITDALGAEVERLDASSAALTLRAKLTPGVYEVYLTPGWELRFEVDVDGYSVVSPGEFELVGPNPRAFQVYEAEVTHVAFAFRRKSTVTFGIEAPDRRITGAVAWSNFTTGTFGPLAGTHAAFQLDFASTREEFYTTWRSYGLIEPSFAWDGTAPQLLHDTYAAFPDNRSYEIVYFESATGWKAQVIANGTDTTYRSVGFVVEGVPDVFVTDADGYPWLLPFCVEDGVARLGITSDGMTFDSAVEGVGTFCFE